VKRLYTARGVITQKSRTHICVGAVGIRMYSGSEQLGIAQSQETFSSGFPLAVISYRDSVGQRTYLNEMQFHFKIYNL
jgi:hypothetical protein